MNLEYNALYDLWNTFKKMLSLKEREVFFKERDIWWCSLGVNLGNESKGKGEQFSRPVLVLKKLSRQACIVLPITSQPKCGTWYVEIPLRGEPRWVMLHQIRMVHIKRFQQRFGSICESDFDQVKQKLELLLKLLDHHPMK